MLTPPPRRACARRRPSSRSTSARTAAMGIRSATSAAKAHVRSGARLGGADAPRPQVEERVLVELTDRRAVPALHVVGEDLELRLRVDERLAREEQVLVRLLRVGLLRVGAHEDLAVEDAARAARRECPCRARGSCRAAARGRSSCGCRRAARRGPRRGRRARTRAPSAARTTSRSLRASAAPRARLWDVTAAARPTRTPTASTWQASVALSLHQRRARRRAPSPSAISVTAFGEASAAASRERLDERRPATVRRRARRERG